MRRIRRSLLALLMAAGTHAVAQGYYEPIPYYGNSPFLFCTLGAPWDCWIPIDRTTGAFAVTNYQCFNPYSAAMFARVCPRASANPTSSLETDAPAIASLAQSSSRRRSQRNLSLLG
jgi:hypothetical protein